MKFNKIMEIIRLTPSEKVDALILKEAKNLMEEERLDFLNIVVPVLMMCCLVFVIYKNSIPDKDQFSIATIDESVEMISISKDIEVIGYISQLTEDEMDQIR